MKNLCILQNTINFNEISDQDIDYLAFDYESHKFLSEKKINHSIIDDYLSDTERIELFKSCAKFLKDFEQLSDTGINFHNVDIISIVDRNEIHEYLMDLLPKIKTITKILEKNTYKKIFVSFEIFEIFHNTKFESYFEKLNYIQNTELTFEKIQIPIKFANQEIKFSLNRKSYKKLKYNVEKISGTIFKLKNNIEEKNKVILLEFDPQIYFELLKEIQEKGLQPVLINFRKSPTHSLSSIKNLKNTNSLIITPENFLEKDELENISSSKLLIEKKLREILENKKPLLNQISKETNFDLLLKNKIISIIFQRLDEYLSQILIAEKVKKMNNVKSIITLNLSGETEKIFSKIQDKTPIILLQHAFANYLEEISYFDILDDFHLIKNKIAVWGDIVKNYLINIQKIPQDKIIVTGSPKYDSYTNFSLPKNDKKIILVTLRPIISHMEGIRITLFEKYKEVIETLIKIFENLDDFEILFKLHPQQNITNEIIIDMIKTNKKFKVLQFEPIKDLLSSSTLHINIAPENFDASSVILEAMLLKKPTLNIQLQKNNYDFEFNTFNAIKCLNYDSDIKNAIFDLIDESKNSVLIDNSQNYLSKYMKNIGSASKKLIDVVNSM